MSAKQKRTAARKAAAAHKAAVHAAADLQAGIPVSFRVPSSDGIHQLACYRVDPEGTPVALFQICHGMCEYFGRYLPFARYLASHGYLVFGHDHLGHGNTATSPDELGFTVSGGGADCLVDDVSAVRKRMQEEYPDLPVILFGHSMGSFIAREVLARKGKKYVAAIICGTGGPDTPAGLGKAVARTIMLFRGERHRSGLLKKMAFLGYNKKYERGCPANAWLSRDEALIRKYDNDPFCQFTFTVRAYDDLFTLVQWVSSFDWAEKLPRRLPCLVTSGEMDPVGGWGDGPRAVAERMVLSGMTEVTLRMWKDMRHEILNEIGKEEVWEDILLWSDKQLPEPVV